MRQHELAMTIFSCLTSVHGVRDMTIGGTNLRIVASMRYFQQKLPRRPKRSVFRRRSSSS